MLARIAAYSVFGMPLFTIIGILAFFFFAATALVGYLIFKGKAKIPFAWHPRMAATALTLAIAHAILAASLLF